MYIVCKIIDGYVKIMRTFNDETSAINYKNYVLDNYRIWKGIIIAVFGVIDSGMCKGEWMKKCD